MLKADKQKEGKTNEGDTDSDEVIAHILQSQFNKEYDTMLKNTEKVVNRDAKGDKKNAIVPCSRDYFK